MELIYEKRDGYAVVSGYKGEDSHVKIQRDFEGLPVMEIAAGVFENHQELLTVEIPMSLQRIGQDCFKWCSNLYCVCVAEEAGDHSVFPPALYYIGDRAFEGTNLKKITFTSPYLELGRYAFHESAVEDVWIRSAIKVTLCEGVFSHCHNLQYVSYFNVGIDDGLPMHAFEHCGKLRKILADYLVGDIGAGCFYDCVDLEELPIHRPLRSVGEEAFSGCKKLKTNFYKTMRDVLNGVGDVELMNQIVEQKTRHCSWGPKEHVAEYIKRIENVAKEVLREIHSTPRTQNENMVLIRAVGSDYYNFSDGWDYVERYYLFSKNDILHRFKPIADFEITCYDYDWPEMRPPLRSLENLSKDDVLRLLMYETGPKPQPYAWDRDLGLLLDAKLAGDAADYQISLATDFLTRLIDSKLYPDRDDSCYNIANDRIAEECFSDDVYTEEEKVVHRLKWDVLFNRINLYRELKKAFFQIKADLFDQGRR